MSLNVLTTPCQIRDVITSIFPDADFQGVVDIPSSFILKVTLSNTLVLNFRHAIDALLFVPAIQHVANQILVKKCIAHIDFSPALEIERFSLEAPLSNWQLFQRTIYERDGLKCEDLLVTFLENMDQGDSLQTLQQLGLAPGQISIECGPSDFVYFEKFIQRLEAMPADNSSQIFAHFLQSYPVVANQLRQKWQAEIHQVEPEDHFSMILSKLRQGVLGQEAASELLAVTLASQQKKDENRAFLFVGPTGVGKTEMAKCVAAIKNDRLLDLRMNQYQEAHSASNLFGSPSGYVGSTDKPHFAQEIERFAPTLIESVDKKQFYVVENIVILFDEIEKAHSMVKQSLLTLLDEGHCTVQYTSSGANTSVKYTFKKSVFIGTSNLYQRIILSSFNSNIEIKDIVDIFKTCNDRALQSDSSDSRFSPEFLGRLTIIPFGPIPKGECYQQLIRSKLDVFMKTLQQEMNCLEVMIENEPEVLAILERLLYGEGTDLRRVRNYFENDVKRVIYNQLHQWGNLKDQRLTVAPYDEHRIAVRAQLLKFGHPFPSDVPAFPI